MAKIPLVTHYSFDSEVPVFLFDTEEEALKELKQQFDEELRIQTEENGHVQGANLETDISPDGRWASITIYYDNQKDVIEWSIGTVKEDVSTNITPDRAKELLNRVIDHEAAGRNCQDTIKHLLWLGFTGEELHGEFGFNPHDVANAEKDMDEYEED